MTSSMKNLFITKKISIQNPLILNNYSIQNIIISPTNLTYEKIDYKNQNANYKSCNSSITPINGYLNGIIPIYFDQKNLNRNITPIIKFKTQAKFDVINLDDINYLSTAGKNIKRYPKILSIAKVMKKKEEKHPEDSVKKNLIKTQFKEKFNKKPKLFFKDKDYKILNYKSNSGSQSLEKNNHKSGPKNSSSRRKIPMNSKSKSKTIFNSNATPDGNLILKEFIFGEQIGKGTFGEVQYIVYFEKDGTLQEAGTTSGDSIVITGSNGSHKIVVKTAYSKYKANMSSGTSTSVDISGSTYIEPSNEPEEPENPEELETPEQTDDNENNN